MSKIYIKRIINVLFILIILLSFNISKAAEQTDFEKIKRYEGAKINKISIIRLPTFKVKQNQFLLLLDFYKISNKLPRTRKEIISSHINVKKGDNFSIEKINKTIENIKKINTIKSVLIEVEPTSNQDKSVNIIIKTKDKYPIMVDPLGFCIIYSNVLGTTYSFCSTFVPIGGLIGAVTGKWNGIQLSCSAYNIQNTYFNSNFAFQNISEHTFSRINISRPFIKPIYLGGGSEIKGGIVKRRMLISDNFKLIKISHSYNKYNMWFGGAIPIGQDEDFYKRIIPTVSYDSWAFYDVSKELLNENNLHSRSRKSIGGGLGFIRKNLKEVNNIYGRNSSEYLVSGQKINFAGGVILQEELNRNYYRLELSNGSYFKNFGYIVANIQTTYVTGGNIDNKNKKDSEKCINCTLSYLSKKIGSEYWGVREALTFDYLGRFGDKDQNLVPIGGIYHFNYYYDIYENLSHRIRAKIENVIFTPLKLLSVTFDPLIFAECVFSKNFKNDSLFKKDYIVGFGLLMSLLGFTAKASIGFSPTLTKTIGDKKTSKIYFSLSGGINTTLADIEIKSPKYKSLN